MDLRNPQEAREHIFGDAVLFTAPGIGMALALDGGAAQGTQDGYVDQVFLLQQEEPSTIDPRLLASAELFYAGRLLMLRTPGSAPLAFTVQGRGDPEPVVDRLPFSPVGAERFTGYGISRRTGAWQVALDEVTGTAMTDLLPACAARQAGEVGVAQVCDSGGEGSTSCGTSCAGVREGGCSTSCGSGYYSCCDKAACTCTCMVGGGGAGPKPPINISNDPPGQRQP